MSEPQKYWFDHEKLEVYREAIAFIGWLSTLLALVAKAKLIPDQIRPGKESLQKIVRMLMGLIKRNSTRDYDKGNAEN